MYSVCVRKCQVVCVLIGLLIEHNYILLNQIKKIFFVVQNTCLHNKYHIDEGPVLIGCLEVPFQSEKEPLIFMMKVIAEYRIILCMLYISLTCYSQVCLFLLYVSIKVGESVLFCVMFCCFCCCFNARALAISSTLLVRCTWSNCKIYFGVITMNSDISRAISHAIDVGIIQERDFGCG